jgi:hypothetical protein
MYDLGYFTTGEGFDEVLPGVETVIDVTNTRNGPRGGAGVLRYHDRAIAGCRGLASALESQAPGDLGGGLCG